MKVCMIIPPKVEELYVHREDKHVTMHKAPFVPYTAPMIYALIEQDVNDVELLLIDAQKDDFNTSTVLNKLDEFNPDIVVTFLGWITIPWDRELAETKYPTIGIILEQWLDQMEALKLYNLKIKYTLYKEIEAPLIESLKEFQIKGLIENSAGVIIRNNEKYTLTSMPNLYDMTKLPMPNFKIFELEKYFKIRGNVLPKNQAHTGYLNTMKSCPFHCSFCGQSNTGSKVRYQDTKHVVRQMKYLFDEYGIEKFEFIDNVFTTNKSRAKYFAIDLINSGLKIRYSINDRLGNYNKELVQLLKKSGCEEVRIGIESCDPIVQKLFNKEFDIEKAKNQIKILQDEGLKIYLYLVTGAPGETKKTLNLNAKFLSDVEPDKFGSSPLYIMPGSPLYYRYKKEGKILVDDWSEYRKFDKLTYINDTYNTIEDINFAEIYMKRKFYIYNILKVKRGVLYIRKNILLLFFQFKFFRDFIRSLPLILRNYIEKITDFQR